MYLSNDFTADISGLRAEDLPLIPGLPAAPRTDTTTTMFGLPLRNSTLGEIAHEIVRRATAGQRTCVSFLNAHCVNVMHRDPAYARILGESDMVLPDGSGMRIAAALAGRPFGDNLNGTDLFPALCAQAADAGTSIFLLGGEPGVAAAAGAEMQRRFPSLRVAGTAHGFFAPEEMAGLLREIERSGASMVFVGLGVPRQERWIAQYADRLSAPVLLGVGGLFDYYSGRIPRAPAALRRVGCEWAWRLCQEPRRLAGRYLVGNAVFLGHAASHALAMRWAEAQGQARIKRAGDLALAALAMVFALPIFLFIAAAIKLEDGGPVFFKQSRVGENGRPFPMMKFRSMVVEAEARRAALLAQSDRDSTCFKMRRDPRVTRVGAVLRRLSLDELPQLLNVLRGDMSLVGPRPALPSEVVQYSGNVWRRLHGKPGITCTWQVSGRAEIPFERQVELDIDYIDRPGVWRDLSLLLRTIPAVLTARGAY